MTGYSKKTLAQKLGIKTDFNSAILNAPEHYFKELDLPQSFVFDEKLSKTYDFIQFFTKENAEFLTMLQNLKKHLKSNGMLWISWPKKASKVKTDLTEDIIREIALQNGLVDIKVCAVNEIWSGLKLVIPVKDRK